MEAKVEIGNFCSNRNVFTLPKEAPHPAHFKFKSQISVFVHVADLYSVNTFYSV